MLATFDNPHQAVSNPQVTYTRTDEREIPLRVSALDRRLTGFEMVVTSSNHAALENVSGALPGMDALAEQWRSEAQYFRRPAQMVATKWAQHPDPQGRPRRRVEPWCLTAAILGRRSYLGVFAEGLGPLRRPRGGRVRLVARDACSRHAVDGVGRGETHVRGGRDCGRKRGAGPAAGGSAAAGPGPTAHV